MRRSYQVLNALPPSAFLVTEDFVTGYDTNPAYAEEQYRRGIAIGQSSRVVGVGAGGTWFAVGKDSSHTTSYEGIGYHAHTADLLRGFFDSGCKVVIERYGQPNATICEAH